MEEILYNKVDWSQANLENWYKEDAINNFLYSYPFNNYSKIIDIGSYDGSWLKKITDMYNCYGLGIEPVNNFFVKSLNYNNSKLQFANIGLTTKEDHSIKINLNNDCTNIFEKNGDTPITLVNAINFFNKIPFEKIDLLQVNIEGYEYDLIPYMIDNNLFDKILNIQIQFHAVSNLSEHRYMDIKSKLNKIGFIDSFDFKFVWYGASKNI